MQPGSKFPLPDISSYDFLVPRQIAFGWGRRSEIGTLAKPLGRRAFLINGVPPFLTDGTIAGLVENLKAAGIETSVAATITHEPEVGDVDRTVEDLAAQGAGTGDFLVGLGGGSAIDLAKAAGALLANRDSSTVKDYLEGVGRGLKITRPPLPVLAMPTTAGTGSEATKNAVISSYDPPFKKSLRSDLMVPQVVLVDPELAISVPPTTTAYTGMDAITQLIESYISRRAKPIPQALCLRGLEGTAEALGQVVANGRYRPARERMAHAALMSGIALANSGLGLAHGVAAALGVHCRVPHGLACAVMLPTALRVNREVRQQELARLAAVFCGRNFSHPEEAVEALISSITDLCERIGIPQRLSAIGVGKQDLPSLVPSSRGASMSGNPRDLSDDELFRLLADLL